MTNPLIDEVTLKQIEQRVLWLAVRMVDYVNQDRSTEIKVGGHQASSASLVSVMAALWFSHIGGDDKVAVKPHASPVYHAIKYLTGELDRSYLTRLRRLGGLQAYPSRTKDPDVADFSTGSVGLGAVAPLFSAAPRPPPPPRPRRPGSRGPRCPRPPPAATWRPSSVGATRPGSLPWWATPNSTRATSGRR